ncbi:MULTISPECIES: hypothetical protein, partial [unclassified Azospirillum]|uniref:hypothetical protein n=1 Tax=unclassified Azospirillum TaxID=2630922 RepID=UPI001B3BCB38
PRSQPAHPPETANPSSAAAPPSLVERFLNTSDQPVNRFFHRSKLFSPQRRNATKSTEPTRSMDHQAKLPPEQSLANSSPNSTIDHSTCPKAETFKEPSVILAKTTITPPHNLTNHPVCIRGRRCIGA